jgi:hypothetical protein
MTAQMKKTNAHGSSFAHRAEGFVAALLASGNVAEAAKSISISEATARRWLRQPKVRRLYAQARLALIEHAQGQLLGLVGESIQALRSALTNGRPGVRVRAALCILDRLQRAEDLQDFLNRHLDGF